VNKLPPRQELPDDIDEHYRRVSAMDPSRPGEGVARAVLAQAAQLAAERAAKSGPTNITSMRAAAKWPWRRPAIFGTLAAAVLAGLLLMPRLFAPSVLPTAEIPPAQNVEPAAEKSVAPAQAVQQSRDAIIDEPTSSPTAQRSSAKRPTKAIGASRSEMAAEPSVVGENATSPVEAFPRGDTQRTHRDSAAAAGMAAPAMLPAAPMLQAAREADDAAAQLRRAAANGDALGLQSLLDEHVGVDTRDARGRTALMLAIVNGRLNAVEVLLKHGADPNATDAHGTTPLQAAISGNRHAIIAALKRAGAR
jgi:Ankyrin repeats (3 copies)